MGTHTVPSRQDAARAKIRLADEYDAAQERGEVATVGVRPNVDGHNVSGVATAADLGLRRDEIHEARAMRQAGELLKQIEPGVNRHTNVPRGDGAVSSRKQAAEDAG